MGGRVLTVLLYGAWQGGGMGQVVVFTGLPGTGKSTLAEEEGRRRGIPGWHEVGWDHVERMQLEYPGMGREHLRVDAVEPVEVNLVGVLEWIGGWKDQRRQ